MFGVRLRVRVWFVTGFFLSSSSVGGGAGLLVCMANPENNALSVEQSQDERPEFRSVL